jgi:replicative DNA helicase
MTNTQPLPHNEEFEKGLLSSIRHRPDILDEIHDFLRADVLYIPAHVLTLEAFVAVRSSSERGGIDFLAVKNHLRTNGKLEEAGGVELLDKIWDFVPTAANWRYYAEGVVEHYQRRVAILESQRLIEQMYDFQRPVEETIRETVERTFAKLATQGGQPEKMLKDRAYEFINILVERREQTGAVTGITFGLPALDEPIGGLQGGDVCVVAADTGVGKSAFALQVVKTTSLDRGLGAALFSLEMPWVQICERLHVQSGVPMKSLRRGIFDDWERSTVTKTTELLIQRNNIFIEDKSGQDISGICSRSRLLKAKHDVKLIVVDYLQLVGAAEAGQDATREREVAAVSHRLKTLAHELDIVVLALSQLNDQGLLRESRAIGQDADVVLIIVPPELENQPHQIQVRKNRNGQSGVYVPVTFHGDQMRFDESRIFEFKGECKH